MNHLSTMELGRLSLLGLAPASCGEAAIGIDWTSVLPTIVGPEEVLTRMKELDVRYASLDREISCRPESPLSLQWAQQKKIWDDFFQGHQGWLDRFMNGRSLSMRLDQFDEEYARFYAQARATYNITSTNSSAMGPAKPDPLSPQGIAEREKESGGNGILAPCAIAGGIVVVGLLAVHALRQR